MPLASLVWWTPLTLNLVTLNLVTINLVTLILATLIPATPDAPREPRSQKAPFR